MSERAPQPEPRKAKANRPTPAAPGIINDLPEPVSPAPAQSMIINDLRPSPASPPAQQMIINDLAPEPGRGGQQMIVNDVPMPGGGAAAQQMVVNDMAFSDLVKGLEALTRGELPGASQTPATELAATPAPRVTARAASAAGSAPSGPAPQANQSRPSPVPLGPDGQPLRTVRKTLAQPGSTATGPGPLAPSPLKPQAADPRQVRPQTAAQPMVINTPQPLVKPRREERPEPAHGLSEPAMPQRLAPDSRTSAATMEAVTIPLTPPKNTTQAAGKKPQKKEAAAKSKPANPDEWNATYAGRTMLPSLMACLALTAGVVGLSVRFLPEEWIPLVLFTTLGFIWMTQLVRWAYRVMLFRYRLTRQHLHLHRGLLYGRPVQVPLDKIAKVSISANLVEKMLGVGTVLVEVKDHTPAVVELEGIRQPKEVVQKLERK